MMDVDDDSQGPGKNNQHEIPIGVFEKCKAYYVTDSTSESPCLQ